MSTLYARYFFTTALTLPSRPASLRWSRHPMAFWLPGAGRLNSRLSSSLSSINRIIVPALSSGRHAVIGLRVRPDKIDSTS